MRNIAVESSNVLQRRIPSLDGLRAISIVLVVLGHAAGTRNGYPSGYFDSAARFGVRIFFLLSGFLITSLLMREQKTSGGISLRTFYTKRALRILPVFYSFLLIVAALGGLKVLHLHLNDLLAAATFTMNFRLSGDWHVAHFWSLSTEEQFYFVWPVLLALAGINKSLKLAILAVLISPVASEAAWMRGYPLTGRLFLSVNAIATGCVFASLRPRLQMSARYMRFLTSNWTAVIGALAVALNLWNGRGAVLFYAIGSVCCAIFVDRLITVKDKLTWLLNATPVIFLGTLSYSLYVWQQIFLDQTSNAIYTSFPLNIILALICSIASFFLIERPFLRLRAKSELIGPRMVEHDRYNALDRRAETLS
jgi:peptidoglycan/LPS O-acetylase OafA/YrhL